MIRFALPALALTLLFTIVPMSRADTPFTDTVPVELVRALLGGGPFGDTEIYSDIASTFPPIDLPAAFTVMGSADRGYTVTVVVSTELGESEANEALYSTYEQAGYTRFAPPGSRRVETGFVHPDRRDPRDIVRFCHDDLGYLSHNFRRSENGTGIINIGSSVPSDARSCAEQLQDQTRALSRMVSSNNLRQYLPVLVLPEPDEPSRYPGPFMFGGGNSSSSNGVETRATLRTDMSLEAVFEHFREQIEDQDWAPDSQNVGSATATANWTKSPTTDVNLIGTLTVLSAGENLFELNFRAVNTSAPRSRGTFISPAPLGD